MADVPLRIKDFKAEWSVSPEPGDAVYIPLSASGSAQVPASYLGEDLGQCRVLLELEADPGKEPTASAVEIVSNSAAIEIYSMQDGASWLLTLSACPCSLIIHTPPSTEHRPIRSAARVPELPRCAVDGTSTRSGFAPILLRPRLCPARRLQCRAAAAPSARPPGPKRSPSPSAGP